MKENRSLNLFRTVSIVAGILFLALAVYAGVYFLIVKPYTRPLSIYHGPTIRNLDRISQGYTLIAPYNNLLNADIHNKGTVHLLDLFGRTVHSWTTERQVLSAQLTKDGEVIVVMEAPKYTSQYPGGGNTGTLQRLDWQGNVQWTYTDDAMHHDLALEPNGNMTYVRWEKTPPDIARTVLGGIPNTEIRGVMWSDEIREIDAKGTTVWSWHAYEHLRPREEQPIDPSLTRAAWTMINGIQYLAKNPLDGEEAYLVSMRPLSTLMMIRKRDGEIIWRSPKNVFNTQHDPNLLPNGNIVAFDNGFTRLPVPVPIYGSRIVEINPKTNDIPWTFDGGPGVMDKLSFFGPLVGGAQPLPNGNFLITEGPRGHIFEVTPDKQIVWDMVSPYTTKQTGAFPINFIFKARRYTKNQVHFPATLPPPVSASLYTAATKLAPIYPK